MLTKDKKITKFSYILSKHDLDKLVEYEKYMNTYIYNQKYEYVWFWEVKNVKINMYYMLKKLLQSYNINL